MVKILFVCTGNICRSPTAEGVMLAKVAAAGLKGSVSVGSAALTDEHQGDPPDPRAIAEARRHGIDLTPLRACRIRRDDFAIHDYVIGFDAGHRRALTGLVPATDKGKVHLLMDFAKDAPRPDVPDPWYGTFGFDAAFALIDQGTDGLLAEIRLRLGRRTP